MTVLKQISLQVQDRLGICLGPQKEYLLASRMEKLRLHEGVDDLERFLGDLTAGDEWALDALSRHVTTNHTYFFRESDHFYFLRDHLVGPIGRPFRIWSAAGSSGEEAYSLAMVLAEGGVTDFRILVSDVNRAVLAQAQEGCYDATRIERVGPSLTQKYFTAHLGKYRAKDILRRRMCFQQINLTKDWDLDSPLDAILCRNVLIYFDGLTIDRVLVRLVASLRPGGWLFLGQTEGFHLPPGTRRMGPAIYQKEGA